MCDTGKYRARSGDLEQHVGARLYDMAELPPDLVRYRTFRPARLYGTAARSPAIRNCRPISGCTELTPDPVRYRTFRPARFQPLNMCSGHKRFRGKHGSLLRQLRGWPSDYNSLAGTQHHTTYSLASPPLSCHQVTAHMEPARLDFHRPGTTCTYGRRSVGAGLNTSHSVPIYTCRVHTNAKRT